MAIGRVVSPVLAVVSILNAARLPAQPTIPRSSIPADLPAEVSHQVKDSTLRNPTTESLPLPSWGIWAMGRHLLFLSWSRACTISASAIGKARSLAKWLVQRLRGL